MVLFLLGEGIAGGLMVMLYTYVYTLRSGDFSFSNTGLGGWWLGEHREWTVLLAFVGCWTTNWENWSLCTGCAGMEGMDRGS